MHNNKTAPWETTAGFRLNGHTLVFLPQSEKLQMSNVRRVLFLERQISFIVTNGMVH